MFDDKLIDGRAIELPYANEGKYNNRSEYLNKGTKKIATPVG
jgi:hypothetical protein